MAGKRSVSNILFSLLLALWGLIILVMTLIPSPPVPHTGLLGWDKFQHAASFGLFAFFCGLALVGGDRRSRRAWILAFALATSYGGLMEILQGLFTVSRSAEFGDLLADAVGAGIVTISAYCLGKTWRR